MNFQEIKQLIKVVERSEIGEIEIVDEGQKIRISKNSKYTPQVVSHQEVVNTAPPAVAPEPKTEPELGENIIEVTSPMVGTFYRAPAPDADPYVGVGDIVKVGQTLCIVEAMKLMNEIQSEVSGKVVKILVENAQPVEYDQVMFQIEKV